MEIVIDFDGTCTTHEFPQIGLSIGAEPVLKDLVEAGHKLILFTMRSDSKSGYFLKHAEKWFEEREIPLYGVQSNPTQGTWTTSPKAYGQLIIDDAALGCPLIYDTKVSSRPYVDWVAVREYLIKNEIL